MRKTLDRLILITIVLFGVYLLTSELRADFPADIEKPAIKHFLSGNIHLIDDLNDTIISQYNDQDTFELGKKINEFFNTDEENAYNNFLILKGDDVSYKDWFDGIYIVFGKKIQIYGLTV